MIQIEDTEIGARRKPYIVAEVGINARNDLTLAKRFIKVAADYGADAVKFQTHLADAEMVEEAMRDIEAGDVYDTVSACEWSRQEHRELRRQADEHGVAFLSTPFSVEAVEILEEIDVPAYKIGSGELTNYQLLELAASTGKPLVVSTGMHTLEEIRDAVEFLDSIAANYALLYCVSEYPTSPGDFDFGTIDVLRELADVPVGFSDHSTGAEAAKVAIGHGAAIVEKHFTIDRRLPGPDQSVSIEPETLSDLCSFAELYHETSTEKNGLQGDEEGIRRWAEHSLVTNRDIEKGETLTEENLAAKRPGTGIPAARYFDLIGEKAARKIPSNSVIAEDDIQSETGSRHD